MDRALRSGRSGSNLDTGGDHELMRSGQQIRGFVGTLATLLALTTLTWPGVAPVRASPALAGVSLARGWVHFRALAPGLGGLPGAQLLAGGPGLVAYDAEGTNFRMYASATTADDDNVKVSAHGELLEGDTAGRRSTAAGL